MPKITRHGGATNEFATDGVVTETVLVAVGEDGPVEFALPERTAVPGNQLPEVPDSAYPPDAQPLDEQEEVEQPSAGKSSEPSSAPAKPSPRKNKPEAALPARTTESPSLKGRTGSSTAGGTGGGQTAATSEGEA